MARHAKQQPLTVTTAPKKRLPAVQELENLLGYDELRLHGTKLPNRYWILGERGWYSVARSSEAARADRAGRFDKTFRPTVDPQPYASSVLDEAVPTP